MYFFARFTQGYPIPYSCMRDIQTLHSYVNFQVNWEMYCKNNKISTKNQNYTQACPGFHSAVKAPVVVSLGRSSKITTAALPVWFTKERGRKGKVEEQCPIQTSCWWSRGRFHSIIYSFIHPHCQESFTSGQCSKHSDADFPLKYPPQRSFFYQHFSNFSISFSSAKSKYTRISFF